MTLAPRGTSTSEVEISHVSRHGVWLLAHDEEHFMPFEAFPWFRDAPIGHILNVEELRSGHFRWPDLDIDLSQEIIDHPERFPLAAKTQR